MFSFKSVLNALIFWFFYFQL